MCYSLRFLVPLILLALLATPAVGLAQRAYSNIGRTPSQEEIQSLGVIVDPSGKNLPAGKGTAKEGPEDKQGWLRTREAGLAAEPKETELVLIAIEPVAHEVGKVRKSARYGGAS